VYTMENILFLPHAVYILNQFKYLTQLRERMDFKKEFLMMFEIH
jgi:hypothetical protein